MCPACMASVVFAAGSVMTTGGLTALAARVFSWKGDSQRATEEQKEKEKTWDKQHMSKSICC